MQYTFFHCHTCSTQHLMENSTTWNTTIWCYSSRQGSHRSTCHEERYRWWFGTDKQDLQHSKEAVEETPQCGLRVTVWQIPLCRLSANKSEWSLLAHVSGWSEGEEWIVWGVAIGNSMDYYVFVICILLLCVN